MSIRRRGAIIGGVGALTMGVLLTGAGCQGGDLGLPEDSSRRGAVVGGAAGAAVGGAVGGWEGAILGGLLGAGGGYVIGAERDRVDEGDEAGAQEAASDAERDPATAEEALRAATADINDDGFVTLDEVVAMSDAGFSAAEMIRRLEATNQVFELTSSQESYLEDQGVDPRVIERMQQMNREEIAPPEEDVIGREQAEGL